MKGKKVVILVIYDIADTKRRNKLIKLLNSYGVRVQKSAFEILVDKNQLRALKEDIKKLIDIKLDNIRFYEVIENQYRIKVGVQSDNGGYDLDKVYIL